MDFLNARCAELEGQLAAERAASRSARLDDEERGRYLGAIGELRREKAACMHELERAAGLAALLSDGRGAAQLVRAA